MKWNLLLSVAALAASTASFAMTQTRFPDGLGQSISRVAASSGPACQVSNSSVWLNDNRAPKAALEWTFCAPGCGSCVHQVDLFVINDEIVARRDTQR